MKRLMFLLVILLSGIISGQAQDKLKIGDVKNGKLVITNPDALKTFFLQNLDLSGTTGKDYQVNIAPAGDRFFVYSPVSGNKNDVSNIGVMLVKIKNEAFIVKNPPEIDSSVPGIGGSGTVTCSGNPCSSCYPEITWPVGNWFPLVVCKCNESSGICNMIISINIQFEL